MAPMPPMPPTLLIFGQAEEDEAGGSAMDTQMLVISLALASSSQTSSHASCIWTCSPDASVSSTEFQVYAVTDTSRTLLNSYALSSALAWILASHSHIAIDPTHVLQACKLNPLQHRRKPLFVAASVVSHICVFTSGSLVHLKVASPSRDLERRNFLPSGNLCIRCCNCFLQIAVQGFSDPPIERERMDTFSSQVIISWPEEIAPILAKALTWWVQWNTTVQFCLHWGCSRGSQINPNSMSFLSFLVGRGESAFGKPCESLCNLIAIFLFFVVEK